MKAALVATALGLAAATAIGSAASCSVDHRSDDFTCETTADCGGGRVCDDGFCVLTDPPGAPDARRPDARPPPDADPCPTQCTSCNPAAKSCVIDCMAGDASCQDGAVICPAGWSCDIRCNTQNSCRSGVNCLNATSCAISCTGESSCRGLQCGPGACDIACIAQNSCRNVACNMSCACGVRCVGQGACADSVTCTSFQCDVGLGCSTVPPGCNTCTN